MEAYILHYSSAEQQTEKLSFFPLHIFIILNITKAQFAFIVPTKDFFIIFSLTHASRGEARGLQKENFFNFL